MATSFSAMDIGRTGLGFHHYWLDLLGHNMANLNTAVPAGEEPFRARFVHAAALTGDVHAATGSGVYVRDVLLDQREGPLVHAPGHPLADDGGYVRMPAIDLAGQLTDMVIAQRGYQANARVVQEAREAYETALRIGAQ